MTSDLTTWSAVLDVMDQAMANPFVFFAELPTTGDEMCLLLGDDDFEGDEDVPAAAIEAGLLLCLGVDQIQGVQSNLLQQDPAATKSQVYLAIRYYFDNDAFVDLQKRSAL